MQIQKEEIRNSILEAAKEEFLTAGYRNSSMRTIAEQAGTTPGNIYAYFSGKEDLLDSIVVPTLDELNDLMLGASKGREMNAPTILELAEQITAVFLRNRTQFLILMNGSEGSRHEHIKDTLIYYAARRMEEELLPKMPKQMQSRLLVETLAQSLLSGVFYLFGKYDGDEEKLKKTMEDYMMVSLYHIGG